MWTKSGFATKASGGITRLCEALTKPWGRGFRVVTQPPAMAADAAPKDIARRVPCPERAWVRRFAWTVAACQTSCRGLLSASVLDASNRLTARTGVHGIRAEPASSPFLCPRSWPTRGMEPMVAIHIGLVVVGRDPQTMASGAWEAARHGYPATRAPDGRTRSPGRPQVCAVNTTKCRAA